MAQFRVLYTDASPQSAEAESALKDSGLDFQSIRIDDPKREGKPVPRLLTSEGYFETPDDIRWYARVYGSGNDHE